MRLLHRDRHRHEDPSPTAETEPIDRIDDDTTRVEGDHLARDDRYDRDHLVERRDAPSTMPAAATDHDRTDDHMAADRADRADRAGVIDAADTVRPVRIRERSWAFAPGQLVSLVVGAALVAVGAVALIRAGLGEPLSTPVVEVLGWTHTAWLGLAEIGVGILLMLVGASVWGKWLSVFLGSAMVVAGVIVRAEPSGIPEELGVEQAFGWPLIALGGVVALAAMILPVWRTSTTNTHVIDLTAGDRRADPDAPINDEITVERREADDSGRHFWSRR